MKKRIFTQMALLVGVGLCLLAVALGAVFYGQFAAQVRLDLQQSIGLFRDDDPEALLSDLAQGTRNGLRVTLVAPDGAVRFDNVMGDNSLENHLDRSEIKAALATGEGESSRFSQTLGLKTYYYAVRLADGSVLRGARTINSIWRMFAGALPVTAAIMLFLGIVGYLAANRLAQSVVAPINRVDLSQEPTVPYDELVPFVKAITRHRRQIAQDSAELQRRSDTINAIMANMNEGVMLLDNRGVILSLNKRVGDIFGVAMVMVGHSVRELIRDMVFFQRITSALEGVASEMPLAHSGKLYSVMISPGGKIGVVVFFLDITERAQAEKLRREFSANVSHELKTPLTSIMGHAEMLAGGVVKAGDEPTFYRKIINEASRLIALIEDILMLSQLDEGGRQARHEPVALGAVAAECLGALETRAAESQVAVLVEGQATLWANPAMMHELFYNLMENGIKYNQSGGTVKVCLAEAEDQVEVTVADNGIGIAPADQQRIFERFYRVDKSRSKKSGGTGLGLAIVKHIVLAHGGRIQVTSKAGQGTAFSLSFPKASTSFLPDSGGKS